MPKYEVYYATEREYMIIVNAESEDEARECWADEAYWESDPECVREDMIDTNVDVVEIN